ncbi:hypothetical protein ACFQMF_14945 [Halorubrum rutilum]|uniref:Uncharacterized protein n=1 Tax=Halorubrum rutilum TaxID=1364933 RepID=A0ABD6ANN1_9EURY
MAGQNQILVALEYVTFGYHRTFFEELVLPTLVTLVLLPGVRSQGLLFETNVSVSFVAVPLVVVLCLLLYWVTQKTYSVKFHQLRTPLISAIGYLIVSAPIPVCGYTLTVVLFDSKPSPIQSIAPSLLFFTGIFSVTLIVRLNQTLLSERYGKKEEFCEQLDEFLGAVERAQRRHENGRTPSETKTIRELNREITNAGNQLVSILRGCRISDEQRLRRGIAEWLDEFESGSQLQKRQLVGGDGTTDTRILYVERVHDGVC